VGDGELRARTEAMMESLGVADRFSVVRHTEDIYSHLAALDLFVLPSLWEGLPYSLLEAMALRKAVVATRVGGVGEVVVPDETGILVPPRDAQALANAMIALLLNPARRATLGQCGRERVEQRFRREEMIACVERLYHELRASSRRGRASPNARRRVSRALPRRA
jgi:glycosyltransferase involved in cell wall biosynthesis